MKAFKPHKYLAQKTLYAGILYDSKLEARVAAQLEQQRLATKPEERIISIVRQKDFTLMPDPIMYKADFLVTYDDGRKEVIEAKGYMTREAKRKLKLFREQYPELKLRIVK